MNSVLLHPSYFPSIAQMVAVSQCQELVFEAADNYQKQTYRNRAYIAHTNGRLLLNVPVKHSKDGTRQQTRLVEVDDSFPWQSQHWKSLQSAYRTSPFFEFYEDDLESLFTDPVTNLFEHNLNIFDRLCELIGLEISYVLTEEYFKKPDQLDLRHLSLAKKGPAFTLEPYTQVLQAHHGFLNNLSVLDLLFNEGPGSLDYLERQQLFF